MGFNNAAERKKFEQRWAILRKKYRKAGMSKEDIDTLYAFDSAAFLSDRRYREHTQPLPMESISDNEDEMSGLFKKFGSLRVTFSEDDFSGRYAWVETVEDAVLYERLHSLSIGDLELLTLFVLDGYTQQDISQMQHTKRQNICNKITRIKKYLK